jgi:hypothetical protein
VLPEPEELAPLQRRRSRYGGGGGARLKDGQGGARRSMVAQHVSLFKKKTKEGQLARERESSEMKDGDDKTSQLGCKQINTGQERIDLSTVLVLVCVVVCRWRW